MQNDDVIWGPLGWHCSKRVVTRDQRQKFCKDENNVYGLCNRKACPLANSMYATVRHDPRTNRLYLYTKTIERAHMPRKLWERMLLPTNVLKAAEIIDHELAAYKSWFRNKCKLRLLTLRKMQKRLKRLEVDQRVTLIPIKKKLERREATWERKAEKIAFVERTVKEELRKRLKSGVYDNVILNSNEYAWNQVLEDLEYLEDEFSDADKEEESEDGEQKRQYVPEFEESEEEDDEKQEESTEIEDVAQKVDSKGKLAGAKRKAKEEREKLLRKAKKRRRLELNDEDEGRPEILVNE